ncbi:MAG TPA: cysteine--tRNA ligase [Gammaproteobacteria bacterium]|nr:cysteine--tRNA ligase [Gammaproteobacteria bacterium]
MLEIYNTLKRRKEVFEPIEPGKVRMYVCGMTVYDLCHLGHARVLVVFDTVVRYLRYSGYDVTYVRNITDIDDKIIQRANENGESIDKLTGRFIQAMHEDSEALNVQSPDLEPRATHSMPAIIDMIQTLIDNKAAYVGPNGDVYYDVSGFAGYGSLSGKKIEDLRAGARVDVDESKQDALDFVLWKRAKPDEPNWDSPWGAGRPGWHIECSAMSTQCLGNHFDIHGGGMDLAFPHHENEIAQSEACTGEHFVNVWMHNGFVQINEEKMSKSLGNFFTIREILKIYRPEEVRYFILSSQYRSPLHYSDDNLDKARGALARLYTALRDLPEAAPAEDTDYREHFNKAMDDDFNSPEALAVLFDMAHDINRCREKDVKRAAALAASMRKLAEVLGLLQQDPESWLQGGITSDGMSDEQINDLVVQRDQARDNKDWAESDRLRDLLQDAGILLEDSAGGTRWRRK